MKQAQSVKYDKTSRIVQKWIFFIITVIKNNSNT